MNLLLKFFWFNSDHENSSHKKFTHENFTNKIFNQQATFESIRFVNGYVAIAARSTNILVSWTISSHSSVTIVLSFLITFSKLEACFSCLLHLLMPTNGCFSNSVCLCCRSADCNDYLLCFCFIFVVYVNHKNIKIPHLEGSYLAITLSLSLEASKASGSSIGAGYIMLRFINKRQAHALLVLLLSICTFLNYKN